MRTVLIILAALVAGCASHPSPADPGEAMQAQREIPPYRLGAGDRLRVIVYGEPSLSGEFVVTAGSGAVDFPLVGEVTAEGHTVREFQEQLRDALLDGYLADPRVNVEVMNYRPYYILGEVGQPGEYPYSVGLTVLNAVATAEGFGYRADTRRVYIRRAGSAREEAYPLTTTTLVAPGDTIRIGERFF